MASTYLNKTFSTTGDRQKFTLSMWFKRGIVPVDNQAGTERMLFNAYQDSSNQDQIWLQSNGTINYVRNNANAVTPFQMLRDPAAWYHVVFAGDTTQGSNADRLKIYINGTQASISQQDTITQGSNFGAINNAQLSTFGRRNGSNDWYFDGSMANIEMVDGQQYGPEYFGSTDTATGIWTPQASSTISNYGTNGYKLKMDTTSPGADTSGKGNTFTPSGSPTLTQGSPSNVYANLNSIDNIAASTFSNGNNTVATVSGNAACNTSTIGVLTGKWYWEVKMSAGESNSEAYIIGLVNTSPRVTGYDGSILANGFGLRGDGNINRGSVPGSASGWNTFAFNNIINVAIDFDNGKAYFGTNGVYGNSSNPSTASNGYSFTVGDEFWRMAVNCRETSKDGTFQCNFGEGFFGTTAAGTNADGNGQGLFAYAVPSGYYAINTKNLEAYG